MKRLIKRLFALCGLTIERDRTGAFPDDPLIGVWVGAAGDRKRDAYLAAKAASEGGEAA